MVLLRWESETLKFGIKPVYKVQISTVKRWRSWRHLRNLIGKWRRGDNPRNVSFISDLFTVEIWPLLTCLIPSFSVLCIASSYKVWLYRSALQCPPLLCFRKSWYKHITWREIMPLKKSEKGLKQVVCTLHQPRVWPSPCACAQPYHSGWCQRLLQRVSS